MSREAIEKAIHESAAALTRIKGLVIERQITRRQEILRSLVDAVLEEACRLECSMCNTGEPVEFDGYWWHPSTGADCRAHRIRKALKSQETVKP